MYVRQSFKEPSAGLALGRKVRNSAREGRSLGSLTQKVHETIRQILGLGGVPIFILSGLCMYCHASCTL